MAMAAAPSTQQQQVCKKNEIFIFILNNPREQEQEILIL